MGNTPVITGLTPGYYHVTVTDSRGCSSENYTFLNVAFPTFGVEMSADPPCHGGTTDLEFSITFGAPVEPLTFTVTGTQDYPPTTEMVIEDVPPGIYKVRATDADGCESIDYIYLRESPEIIINGSVNHICENDAIQTGNVILNASGGVGSYSAEWCCGGGQSGMHYLELEEGNYSVTVTDGDGCTASETYFVANSPQPVVHPSITPASCSCCNDGALYLAMDGVNPPYEVNLDGQIYTNVESGLFVNDLTAGKHYYEVKNVYGCTNVGSTTYFDVESELPPIEIEVVEYVPQTPAHWGSIDIEVMGGETPYSYSWSDVTYITTQDRHTLWAGTYTVTVTDQFGCTAVETIVICNNPPSFNYSRPDTYPVGYVTPCMNGNSGSMSAPEPLPEHGGSEPFSYRWSGPNGFSSEEREITYLTDPGDYHVTIMDACGLSYTYTQELRCDNCELEWGGFVEDCTNSEDGTIHVETIGDFTNHEYFIVWPEGIADVALVENNSQFEVPEKLGVSKVKIKQGTTETVSFQIVDAEWGCSVSQTILFSSSSIAEFKVFESLYEFDQNGYDADEDVIYYLESNGYTNIPEGYIHRQGLGEPCRGHYNDHSSWVLTFSPKVEDSNPCWNGGAIPTRAGTISVPMTTSGIEFSAGNRSYCMWPSGTLVGDPVFDRLAEGTLISQHFPQEPFNNFVIPEDPWTAAVIAKIYTPVVPPNNDDNNPPPPPPPEYGNCDALSNPCGPETPCIFVTSADECMISVYCNPEDIGDEDLVVATIEGLRSICLQNSNNTDYGCRIVLQCSQNSCDMVEIARGSLDNDFITTEEIQNGINSLPEDLQAVASANLAGLLNSNCGGDGICYCDQIGAEIGYCFDCFTGGGEEHFLMADPNLSNSQTAEPSPFMDQTVLKVFPNPFSNDLTIEIMQKEGENAEVRILNLLGEQLWYRKDFLQKGRNTFTWSPDFSVPNGIYYVHMVDETGRQMTKKVVYSSGER